MKDRTDIEPKKAAQKRSERKLSKSRPLLPKPFKKQKPYSKALLLAVMKN